MKADQKLTIYSLIKNNPGMLWLALILGTISSLAAVFLLAVSGWFITSAGLAGAMGLTIAFNFFTPGAIIRLMAILRTSGRYAEQLTAHYHLLDLLKDLRLWVWKQLTRHALPQHLRIGALLQRIVSDVDLLNSWPLQVWMPRIYAWICVLFYLVVIDLFAHATLIPMASGLLINCIVLPWLCYKLGKRMVWQLQLIGIYRRSRFINFFGALITLSIRGRWQNYAQRLFEMDNRQFDIEYRMQVLAAATRHLMLAIIAITIMSSSILAAPQLINGTINGSVFAGLLFALLGLNEVLSPLAMSFIGTAKAQVGVKRLNQLCPDQPIAPPENHANMPELHEITFRQATIRKSGAVNGISQLDLQLSLGMQLWLRGPSGIGKSTLLDAIANQLEPESGEIDYNGQSLRHNERLRYQSQIGYLSQSPYIFNQTIAGNLRLGDEQASDEQLFAALKAVALEQWVAALPKGMNTLLGAQGSNISGGQARRLALARVLLQKPVLMLLDEPFEGLDKQTIDVISTALQGLFKPPILVVASHLDVPMFEQFQQLKLLSQ
ncbi:amino acid ABC transporter ATP-binding/permease protein [Celerinatantimonas yamalensis]|uniref:ATP-binding cassette domain-containing protein n=1 Tax=Celerinatantimonas yamalensis TaxID=559956 RepID=A0ABW9G372_9GAMM